jgi:tetratricopeptide (TPR) repeat protein
MIARPQPPSGRDDAALELMNSAAELAPKGEWLEAATRLEQAAALHAEAGRDYDEARCLQMAATLRRSGGQLAGAGLLIERARAIEPDDERLRLSILAEQAEIAFAGGKLDDAIVVWSAALELAPRAGLLGDGTSALLRRRAAALVAVDRLPEAATDFDAARRLLADEHGAQLGGFVRTEQARLLLDHGQIAEAERVLSQLADELGAPPADQHLLSELLVARARIARAGGHTEEALATADEARAAALAAVAPVAYFSASVELAEAQGALDLRAEAYGTLATALVTLGDVVGLDAARSWVEPVLIALRVGWGGAAFDAAKADYERRRRDELGETQ